MGVRVLQEQLGLRAHSEIKQGLLGHCGIRPVFLSHESQRFPSPSSTVPTSGLFVNITFIHCCHVTRLTP